jgi:amino acid transporter
MGTVVSSVISCLCEMTALMPVNAPSMEFPRRFLDRGVGFAVGWLSWAASIVAAAAELVAVAKTIQFQYNDGETYLDWNIGVNIDDVVWISIFLIIVICINMLPVKVISVIPFSLLIMPLTIHDRFMDRLDMSAGALR